MDISLSVTFGDAMSKMFGSLETLTMCIRYSCSKDKINDEESIEIFSKHKMLIKKSWKVVFTELAKPKHNICGVSDIAPTDTFIEMFEKYPETSNFFVQFNGNGFKEIQADPDLLNKLKEHSERVFLVVEKVIKDLGNSVEQVDFVQL